MSSPLAARHLLAGKPPLSLTGLCAVDPEMKAEIEERQRNGPMAMMAGGQGAQQQNSLGNFDMAAYLAGSGKKEGGGGGGGGGGSAKSQGVRR